MDEHPQVIRQRIEETKAGLNEKLETLEQRYGDTVETVGNVVEGTLDAVQSVAEALDFPRHVRRHPWSMFAGSMALGFVVGRMLDDRAEPSAAAGASAPAEPTWLSQQLGGLRDLALGGLVAVVRDLARQNLPPVGRKWVDEQVEHFVAGKAAPRGISHGDGNGGAKPGRPDRLSWLH